MCEHVWQDEIGIGDVRPARRAFDLWLGDPTGFLKHRRYCALCGAAWQEIEVKEGTA